MFDKKRFVFIILIFFLFSGLVAGIFHCLSGDIPLERNNNYSQELNKRIFFPEELVTHDMGGPEYFLDKIKSLNFNSGCIPKTENKFRVVIANSEGSIGETQTVQRMFDEFRRRGFEFFTVNEKNSFLVEKISPHLFISLRGGEFMPVKNKNIKSLSVVHCAEFLEAEFLKHTLENLKKYDGFLCTVPNVMVLKACCGKKDFKKLDFLLSCKKSEFCDAPKKELFFCGSNWDERRASEMNKLYKMLDESRYTSFYGPKCAWESKKLKNYKFEIPYDNHSIFEIMKEKGIALVIHSKKHFDNNITTARIFEAAASSCLIICDELPFVKENFGDSVFYIDVNKSYKEIFKKINSYVMWARNNPNEAMAMAKKSHEIFVKNFTIEKQVDKIMDLYKSL